MVNIVDRQGYLTPNNNLEGTDLGFHFVLFGAVSWSGSFYLTVMLYSEHHGTFPECQIFGRRETVYRESLLITIHLASCSDVMQPIMTEHIEPQAPDSSQEI